MNRLRRPLTSPRRRPRIWLAAINGTRLPAPTEDVGPIDGPERPLEVEFVGINQAQQARALASFPGGRRFVLKQAAD